MHCRGWSAWRLRTLDREKKKRFSQAAPLPQQASSRPKVGAAHVGPGSQRAHEKAARTAEPRQDGRTRQAGCSWWVSACRPLRFELWWRRKDGQSKLAGAVVVVPTSGLNKLDWTLVIWMIERAYLVDHTTQKNLHSICHIESCDTCMEY
jgi:hypothetical protein